jgi:membrane-bound metal-dependent hydrolase YbcI (DUF457 family)
MIVGGLCAGTLVASSVAKNGWGFEIGPHTLYPVVGVVPAVIGALGPDVDMEQTPMGKWTRRGLIAVGAGSGVIGGLALFIPAIASRLSGSYPTLIVIAVCSLVLYAYLSTVKHRKQTHGGFLALGLSLPILYVLYLAKPGIGPSLFLSVWVGFWLGWVSHLVADSFNKKGVPWLYPLSDEHYHIATIVTGSRFEVLFRYVNIAVFSIVYTLIFLIDKITTAGGSGTLDGLRQLFIGGIF